MILKCVRNRGERLAENYRGLFYTENSSFDISIEGLYEAYALGVFNGGITVLIKDDTALPNWYPAQFFVVTDGKLPQSWTFSLREGQDNGLRALIGYPELVNDASHYDALIERDRAALEIFNRIAVS